MSESRCRYELLGLGHCSTSGEYIAKLKREILSSSSMALPSVVLMGTPALGAATAMEAEEQRYMSQWYSTGAALDAEERRQRRDYHVDAVQYALTGKHQEQCGRYASKLVGGCDRPRGHDGFFGGPVRVPASATKPHHVACPGCFQAVTFTVNDCLAHHASAAHPCPWSGRQRAAVESAVAIRAAEERAYRDAGVPIHDYCACGRTMSNTEKHCRQCEPIPPTLREWLGDRVSELGRWAEVLREQPVPAGLFLRFEWTGSEWRSYNRRGSNAITKRDVIAATRAGLSEWEHMATANDAWLEAVQMAMFTRHPDVKPEPPRAEFPWDPYPEVV